MDQKILNFNEFYYILKQTEDIRYKQLRLLPRYRVCLEILENNEKVTWT